jgi:6-phosphogluconate dehydrogenase
VLPVRACAQSVDKAQLVDDVKQALYAAKICSYAQGMNIIKSKSDEQGCACCRCRASLGQCCRTA